MRVTFDEAQAPAYRQPRRPADSSKVPAHRQPFAPDALGGSDGKSPSRLQATMATEAAHPRLRPKGIYGDHLKENLSGKATARSSKSRAHQKFNIELCAGSAGYSAKIFKLGMLPLAVDHSTNRHKQLFPCVTMDLTQKSSQDILEKLLSEDRVFSLGAAPPCGTATRAREKRIRVDNVNRRGPPPLRSDAFPEGIPAALQGARPFTKHDADRLQQSNCIYLFICKLMTRAHALKVHWWVENPKNSLMWATNAFKDLALLASVQKVDLQACMFGSLRPKWTSFLTNISRFSELALECDHSHPHAPWQVQNTARGQTFDTASEAEYPPALCQAMAAIIHDLAVDAGMPPHCADKPDKTERDNLKAAAGRQPRGTRFPRLLPEFLSVETVPADNLAEDLRPHIGKVVPQELMILMNMPGASGKLLELRENTGGEEPQKLDAKIGVYDSKVGFAYKACQLQHPFDEKSAASDLLLKAIFELLTAGPDAVEERREELFKYYEERLAQLDAEESRCHASVPEAKRHLIRGKKFILLQEMARDMGYDDAGLSRLGISGTRLTGIGEDVPAQPAQVANPTIDDRFVMQASRFTRHVNTTFRASENKELDEAVYQTTKDEREKGWLEGPFSEEELKSRLGPLFVVNNRFGIMQGGKVRAIDNYSSSFVNLAYATPWRLEFGGVDLIVNTAKSMLDAVADDGTVKIELSCGTILEGKLHSSLSVAQSRRLVGRTLDLSNAYRQLFNSPASEWCSVIGTPNPHTCKVELDIQHANPFGATACVYAFNRFAKAIWWIGVAGFMLIWTNHFDDYPQLDLEVMGQRSHIAAERLMALVGWSVSQDEAKRQPFQRSFAPLGVVIDFKSSEEGKIILSNKSSRTKAIAEECRAIISADEFHPPGARSLLGRVSFCEAQCFSRFGAAAVKSIAQKSREHSITRPLPQSLRDKLAWLANAVEIMRPKVIDCRNTQCPIVLFTDGAAESSDPDLILYDVVSVGGVAIDTDTGSVSHFGSMVPKKLVDEWKSGGIQQVITQAEVYPVLLAKFAFGQDWVGRRVISFIDNDAARYSLINANSSSETVGDLLMINCVLDSTHDLSCWYERVASDSNIADAPSRLDFKELIELGSTFHNIQHPPSILEWKKASMVQHLNDNKGEEADASNLVTFNAFDQQGVTSCLTTA